MPVLRETRNRREATRSVSSRFCKLNLICSSRRLPSTPHLARWQRAKHDRFRPLCRPRSVPIGALLQLRRIWPPVIRLYQCANRRRSGPRPWCKPCTLFRGSRSARSAGSPHNVRGFMLQQADHGLGSQMCTAQVRSRHTVGARGSRYSLCSCAASDSGCPSASRGTLPGTDLHSSWAAADRTRAWWMRRSRSEACKRDGGHAQRECLGTSTSCRQNPQT